MNKKELAVKAMFPMEKAAADGGWPAAADALFATVAEALRRGERIEIRGFGTFSVNETKARNGRNPRTGQPVKIPAGRRVRFKPSKTLLG
ncbi:MAG TPA: HU family DNA-binding protein [Stellaceae bacterium]|nr:HU family DNA-binding protein [Stellaceae bacterium]